MNIKNMKNRIRGWLPKEPVSPSNQDSRMVTINQKNSMFSARAMGVIAFGSLFLAVALIVVPNILSPQSYIPKADPSMGYSSPKTLDAWIILAVALVLLAVSLLAFAVFASKLRSQGSIWVSPRPWILSGANNDLEMKIFKLALAANVVMVAGFVGTLALTKGTFWGINSTAAAVIIFNVLIFLVNLSLYQYYRKQATKRRM
jgi:hypothetical protein